MEDWIQHALSGDSLGLAVLPAALLLGVLGAIGSCCTLPVLAAVAGYSGSLTGNRSRREVLLVGLFFMLGTMVALTILGAITGFVGQMAGAALGRTWTLFAGIVMVFFGMVSLDLVPFSLPRINVEGRFAGRGPVGAMVYGLAVGGATTACSVCCNPVLAVALGASVLQGATLLGAVILAVFAVGYSLPLTAGLVGIGMGLGALGRIAEKTVPFMRVGAGILLVGTGIFLVWPE